MRVFIALDVPAPWRAAASDAQRTLRAASAPALLRFVDPALMHLTLRFLGEIDAAAAARLQPELSSRIGQLDFVLALGRAGTFGPPARTTVVWLGVEGDREALDALVATVRDAVAAADLPDEPRPFRPHLTLARVHRSASGDDRRDIAAAVDALDPPPASPSRFREVMTVQSHLGGAQPRYEVLSRHGSGDRV